MISHITAGFRSYLDKLPEEIQRRAKVAYSLFKDELDHRSLQFKQVHPTKPIFMVRISLGYRAIGVCDGNELIWFWGGPHGDHERSIARMWSMLVGEEAGEHLVAQHATP